MNHPLLGLLEDDLGTMGATISTVVSKTDPNYLMGVQIITVFHENSKKYAIYKMKTVDDLINYYGVKGPILAQGLGRSFKLSEKPNQYFIDKMTKLAADSKGRIPKWQAFVDYLTTDLLRTDYWDVISSGVSESVGTIASKVQDTTVAALGSLSNVIKILPYIALVGGMAYVYLKFFKDIKGSK